MLFVQVQGEGLGPEEERRRESGAERQAGQRRRWREGRDEGGGGLEVQFYSPGCKHLVSGHQSRGKWVI